MKTIKFLSHIPMGRRVTGGEIYDLNLLNVMVTDPQVDASNVALGIDNPPNKIADAVKAIFKGLKQRNNDVLIFNSSKCLRFLPLTVMLRYIFRKNIMVIHHHFIYKEFRGFQRWIYKHGEALFLKTASKVIAPSPYIEAQLKKSFPHDKILLWRIPFESTAQFPANPIKGNLTFTGTIEPRKGLIYLLEALKEVQDKGIPYKLKIVGKTTDQTYFEELQDFARRHKLNIEFTGFVSKEEKNKILSETYLFVFPSLLEGFGMVLVEAQVYGLPIVCFNNSAMPFTVTDGENGLVVKNKDSKVFAEAIITLLTDRKMREHFSAGALNNVLNQWTQEDFQNNVRAYFATLP